VHGPPLKPDVVEFGDYEIHLTTNELFKHATRIRLAPKANTLMLLLDSGGILDREQFHRAMADRHSSTSTTV
jgi:DNA-binding response OmpR family regulator